MSYSTESSWLFKTVNFIQVHAVHNSKKVYLERIAQTEFPRAEC